MVAWNDVDGDAGSLYLCQLFYHIIMTLYLAVFREVADDEKCVWFVTLDSLDQDVKNGDTELLHFLVPGQIGLPCLVVASVDQRWGHDVGVGENADSFGSVSRQAEHTE